MNALSEYGKILRHYRLDNQIILATMAKDLGLSSAYLSSIETGARPVPADLTEKLAQKYGFDDGMKARLMKAEVERNKSLTLHLENASPEAIDTAVMFARELNKKSVKELRDLYNKICGMEDSLER